MHHLEARADRHRQQSLAQLTGEFVHHDPDLVRHRYRGGIDRRLVVLLHGGGPLSLSVVLGGTPDTYQLAGHGRGMATAKFNDYRDNFHCMKGDETRYRWYAV